MLFFFLDIFYPPNAVFFCLFGRLQKGGETTSCCVKTPAKRVIYVTLKKWTNNAQDDIAKFTREKGITSYILKEVERKRLPEFTQNDDFLDTIIVRLEIPVLETKKIFELETHKAQYPSIVAVNGLHDNIVEQFLVENRIKGNSWIQFEPSAVTEICDEDKVSLCETELMCELHGIRATEATELPVWTPHLLNFNVKKEDSSNSLKSISLQFMDLNGSKISDKKSIHIIKDSFTFDDLCLSSPKSAHGEHTLYAAKNDHDMLRLFFQTLQQNPFDMILNFGFLEETMETLHALAFEYGHDVSCFGKLKRLNNFQIFNSVTKNNYLDPNVLFPGVVVLDLYKCSSEFIPKSETLSIQEWIKVYGNKKLDKGEFLKSLRHKFLDRNDRSYMIEEVSDQYYFLENQLDICIQKNWIPITSLIASKSGIPWKWVCWKNSMKRSEFILNHAFHAAGYLLPPSKHTTTNSSEQVKGGTNLPPKPGFYSGHIVLLDGKHLYPACVVERNLCLNPKEPLLPSIFQQFIKEKEALESKIDGTIPMESEPFKNFGKENLVTARTVVKLLLNKMYGCFANLYFRFSSQRLANEITEAGRNFLEAIIRYIEKDEPNAVVLFGVTDSVCVYIKKEADEAPNDVITRIVSKINSMFHFIRVKHEQTFTRLLVPRQKNKYAGLTTTGQIVAKGFGQAKPIDLQFAPCVSESLFRFLEEVLKTDMLQPDLSEWIHVVSSQLGDKIFSGEIPKEKLVMRTFISKNLEEYQTKTGCGRDFVSALYVYSVIYPLRPKPKTLRFIRCRPSFFGDTTVNAVPVEVLEPTQFLAKVLESTQFLVDVEYYTSQFLTSASIISETCFPQSSFSTPAPKKQKMTSLNAHLQQHRDIKEYEEIAALFVLSSKFEKVNDEIVVCSLCNIKQVKKSSCINPLCLRHAQ